MADLRLTAPEWAEWRRYDVGGEFIAPGDVDAALELAFCTLLLHEFTITRDGVRTDRFARAPFCTLTPQPEMIA